MENEYVTAEDKINLINNFIKNISYNRYNAYLALLAESAVQDPNQSNIDNYTNQIEQFDAKILALQNELLSVEGE